MAQTIAVTRKLPEGGERLLDELAGRGDVQVRRWPGELPPAPADLDDLLAGASGVISLLTEKIDGALLSMPRDAFCRQLVKTPPCPAHQGEGVRSSRHRRCGLTKSPEPLNPELR